MKKKEIEMAYEENFQVLSIFHYLNVSAWSLSGVCTLRIFENKVARSLSAAAPQRNR
jgi:hypothetical protein